MIFLIRQWETDRFHETDVGTRYTRFTLDSKLLICLVAVCAHSAKEDIFYFSLERRVPQHAGMQRVTDSVK